MRDNKNQLVSHSTAGNPKQPAHYHQSHASTAHARFETVIAAAVKAIDENNKRVRRYSFDDNGGGYQGL